MYLIVFLARRIGDVWTKIHECNSLERRVCAPSLHSTILFLSLLFVSTRVQCTAQCRERLIGLHLHLPLSAASDAEDCHQPLQLIVNTGHHSGGVFSHVALLCMLLTQNITCLTPLETVQCVVLCRHTNVDDALQGSLPRRCFAVAAALSLFGQSCSSCFSRLICFFSLLFCADICSVYLCVWCRFEDW